MIAPVIQAHFRLDEAQQQVVGHLDGPLVVIAGPGSGKTRCLIARTLNLLVLERTRPERILLCTFTERATREMQDRLLEGARRVGYRGGISRVQVSTIHGLSLELLRRMAPLSRLHRVPRTLDDISRRLFLERHFQEIAGPEQEGRFLGRWQTRNAALEALEDFFDRIADELIDPDALAQSGDPFFVALSGAYQRYRDLLERTGRIDFAHQQRLALELLEEMPEVRFFDYIMVDEYQDTNHIQEQLLLRLAGRGGNLCVVGDEDQSLYRFRGATPTGFLTLPERLERPRLVRLERNYRSHPMIIAAYDNWMASADWRGPDGRLFRYGKRIEPATDDWESFPALVRLFSEDADQEAERIAELVVALHRAGKIQDWSEVAVLLPSVRRRWSSRLIAALEKRGVPVWCPRSRTLMEHEEIRLAVGVLVLLLDAVPRAEEGMHLRKLQEYVLTGVDGVVAWARQQSELGTWIKTKRQQIERRGRFRPTELFYELLGAIPFRRWYYHEERARRLALFSRLLSAFEEEFSWHAVPLDKKDLFLRDFLGRFLRRLVDAGVNEVEPEEEAIPSGRLPILTIHQAKGLEFPVVIVGGLSRGSFRRKRAEDVLQPFYRRQVVEPIERMAEWEQMRLYYVAFSRAQQLLVLSATGRVSELFRSIWEQAQPLEQARAALFAARRFVRRPMRWPRQRLRFVEDVLGYAACPRRYQAFGYLGFMSMEEPQMIFGTLLHRVLETINRYGLYAPLNGVSIEQVAASLEQIVMREAEHLSRESGWYFDQKTLRRIEEQARRYCQQAQAWFSRIEAVEMPLTLEVDGCVLVGSCDLLVGEEDGRLTLFDFKTSTHQQHLSNVLDLYWCQLAIYAHLVEQELSRPVSRLVLYWTAVEDPEAALQERLFDEALHREAVLQLRRYLDGIRARRFRIEQAPPPVLCNNCSMRWLCRSENIKPVARRSW